MRRFRWFFADNAYENKWPKSFREGVVRRERDKNGRRIGPEARKRAKRSLVTIFNYRTRRLIRRASCNMRPNLTRKCRNENGGNDSISDEVARFLSEE